MIFSATTAIARAMKKWQDEERCKEPNEERHIAYVSVMEKDDVSFICVGLINPHIEDPLPVFFFSSGFRSHQESKDQVLDGKEETILSSVKLTAALIIKMPKLSDTEEYELSKSINRKFDCYKIFIEQEKDGTRFNYMYDYPLSFGEENIGNVSIEMLGRLNVAIDSLFPIIDEYLAKLKERAKNENNRIVTLHDLDKIGK